MTEHCKYCEAVKTNLNFADACPYQDTQIGLTGVPFAPQHEWVWCADVTAARGAVRVGWNDPEWVLTDEFEKHSAEIFNEAFATTGGGPLAPKPGLDEYGNRLPQDSDFRKQLPVFDGCFDYVPDALAYVSLVSKEGADKHCDGVLGWDRDKSTDHLNCLGRHLLDIRGRDPNSPNKLRHAGMAIWRLLAFLQLELEKAKMNGESWV